MSYQCCKGCWTEPCRDCRRQCCPTSGCGNRMFDGLCYDCSEKENAENKNEQLEEEAHHSRFLIRGLIEDLEKVEAEKDALAKKVKELTEALEQLKSSQKQE